MEFFAILIAWAAVQFWGSGVVVQKDDWIAQFRRVLRYVQTVRLRLVIFLAAPALLVAVILWLLGPLLFGLPFFFLSVLILLYSLGRGDFQTRLRLYLNSWQRGDLEGAYLHAQQFSPELCDSGAENAEELHSAVRKAVFYQGFERWFAAVFWFFALGPAVALLYRLLFIASRHDSFDQEERDQAKLWLYYAEWIPVRLLGFAFALVGDFDGSFRKWRESLMSDLPAEDYLDALGCLSLPCTAHTDDGQFTQNAAKELQCVQQMLSRSLLCWIAVMALMQLF